MTTQEITTKIREYKELQAYVRELEEELEATKAAIISEMEARKVNTLLADVYTVKYQTYSSTRIDTTAFKAELPDVAAKYTKTTEARRFSVA